MRSSIAVFAVLFFLMLVPLAQCQVSEGPIITDKSSGIPSTNSAYELKAEIHDPDGIDTVRFYVYFKVGDSISTPEYPAVMSLLDGNYSSQVQVPINASQMFYTISASDSLDNWKITDVIDKMVEDTIPPNAVHNTSITVDASIPYMFNGSSCTDNVGIDNYSWAFTFNGQAYTLYGEHPFFNFTAIDTTTVTLAVSDSWNNIDNMKFNLGTRDVTSPVADPGMSDYFVVEGNSTTFDGSGSYDDIEITSYEWTFLHNDTLVNLTGETPEFRFWETGEHTITLSVTDDAGNANTVTFTVHVLDDPNATGEIPWWALILAVSAVILLAIMIILFKNKEDK